jgi:hypothetical protein
MILLGHYAVVGQKTVCDGNGNMQHCEIREFMGRTEYDTTYMIRQLFYTDEYGQERILHTEEAV